jgi:hypothetical protein
VNGFGGWEAISMTPHATCMGTKAVWHLPSTTTSLGGMVQQGLDDGRGMMDARRVVESSGIVVALMGGLTRSMT